MHAHIPQASSRCFCHVLHRLRFYLHESSPKPYPRNRRYLALVLRPIIIIPNLVMSFTTRTLLVWTLLLPPRVGFLHAQPSDLSADATHFQRLEDNWSIAFVKKDQFAMELLLAPTFVNISAAGAVSTRNQLLAEMFEHTTGDLLSMEQRAVNVRVLSDVALVQGTYVIHYKAGPHTVDERGVFTHIYQRSRTNWLCVSAQRTAVFDQTDEKQKQAGKKSSAALPFHVPLIYKGADSTQTPPPPDKQPQP